MSIVTNNEELDVDFLQFDTLNKTPSGAVAGSIWYDDGTNTFSGHSGLRINNGGLTVLDIPEYSDGVASYGPTIGDASNLFSTSAAQGSYITVGRLCHVDINLIWVSKGTASSEIRISLPFAAENTANHVSGLNLVYANGLTIGTGFQITFRAIGTSYVTALVNVSGTNGYNLDATDFTATGQLTLTGSYFMDAALA